jgi:outer membrane protein OmpA-like peptidoglycan-associated protein
MNRIDRKLPLCWLLAAVALGGTARHARAETSGMALNRFEPAERGSEWFANASLDFRGKHRPAFGVVYDWGYRSFVLHDAPGGEVKVLTDQMFVHLGGAIVLGHNARLAFNLPITAYENGDDLAPVERMGRPNPQTSYPGAGDLRLAADARVFGEYGDVVTGALGVQAFLPTGSRDALTSDGTIRVIPHFMVAGEGDGFVYAARIGFHYRPQDDVLLGRSLGSEVVASIAGGVKVNDVFVFGPELWASTVVTGRDTAFHVRNTPIEGLLGFHVTLGDDFRVGSGIGAGFTRGDGCPSMRALVSFDYAPDFCVDADGDGICATEDACPNATGVPSTDPKTNGCPVDRDRDGYLDKEDACPDVPGVKTGDPTTTGCPDRDSDGVVDGLDACPEQPGVTTSEPSTNGCPKPASEPPIASVAGAEIQLSSPVQFVAGSADLEPASETILASVAKLLVERKEMHVAVRARVSGKAPLAQRRALAKKRAAVVEAWLTAHGVEAARLVPGDAASADEVGEGDVVFFHVVETPEKKP